MEVTKLEYDMPSREVPGSLLMEVRVPVAFTEGMKSIPENSDADVKFSKATVDLVRQACLSAVRDIEASA